MRLILLRHAKSSWDHPGLPDHERPLAPRGVRAARSMAALLEEEGTRVDLVLSSTAVRARATAERVLKGIGPAPDLMAELYLASAGELLRVIRGVDPDVRSLAVVGHNPGLHDLALRLCGSGPREVVGRIEEKFPTGALAEFQVEEGGWDQVAPGSTRLLRFIRPRDLPRAPDL